VPTRVLVLGATGYVGGRLVPRLLDAGYLVRCLVRDPGKAGGTVWGARAEVMAGDLLEAGTLDAAFADVGVVVHLVHSMGSSAAFADADRRIARNVAAAAAAAGARRIVYLGGLGEVNERSSAHLRSRAEVGDILLAGSVPATVVRAAVVVGSGSASFEMLRHLVEKLPVMVAPRWVRTRVQPIAIRDVLRYLVGVVQDDSDADHVYDIGGPDVLTYLEMMQVYARVAGLPRRLVLTVPVLSPKLSSHWIGLVTPVPVGVAKPLVESLSQEVVVRRPGQRSDGALPAEDIATVVPGACLGYEEALRLALLRVRDRAVETSWREAELAGRSPAEPLPEDPVWAGGTLFADDRSTWVPAAPLEVFATVCRLGGDRGWPAYGWAWRVRGWVDQALGGVGLRRGRRDPDALRVGDALDFWRVEAADRGSDACVLRLRAEMRLPGRAWLEWRIDGDGRGGARLRQRALFAPRGLLGRVYWWVLVPVHGALFGATLRWLAARAAEGAEAPPST
jgi:uncharacterized protein YbjT (DUF2867 family)